MGSSGMLTSPLARIHSPRRIPNPPRAVRMTFYLLSCHQRGRRAPRQAPRSPARPWSSQRPLPVPPSVSPPPPAPIRTGAPWQRGGAGLSAPRGRGRVEGIPATQRLQSRQQSQCDVCRAATPPPATRPPPAPGFPTCRGLQRPDVLGPEGAVGLLQAPSIGQQGAELLVDLSIGTGDKVGPGHRKFRHFPRELMRVVGISGKMRRKNPP